MFFLVVLILGISLFILGKNEIDRDVHIDKGEIDIKGILKIIIYIGYFIHKRVKCSERTLFYVFENHRILYGKEKFKIKSIEYFSKKYFFHYFLVLLCGVLYSFSDVERKNIIYVFIGGNFLTYYYFAQKLSDDVKKRKEQLLEGFFEFSTKFTLFIGAGLNFNKALEKSIGNNEFSSYLKDASKKVNSGRSVSHAFEDIATDCRDIIINQYISCIVQSAKRGNYNIAGDLKKIMSENWNTRIGIYKKWGEELKTKLLIPMMIIFVGIMIILMAPVVLKLQAII